MALELPLGKEFLGRGWAFPPQLDKRGSIALTDYDRDVEEAIKIILLTRVGERPMRPEFGSKLHLLLFEPNNGRTAGLAIGYVQESLERWEPRIDSIVVDAGPAAGEPECLVLDITYRIRMTNAQYNLVFPFYIIPGED